MARMSRQQAQQITRERLRSAAAIEFAKKGFAGSSIDSITETASLSRGAFYSNYASKTELMLEVMRSARTEEHHVLRDLVRNAPREEAFAACRDKLVEILEHEDHRLLASELGLQAWRDVSLRDAYEHCSGALLESAADLVGAWIDKLDAGSIDKRELAVVMRALWCGLPLLKPSEAPAKQAEMMLRVLQALALSPAYRCAGPQRASAA